jgi:hypothetical protein
MSVKSRSIFYGNDSKLRHNFGIDTYLRNIKKITFDENDYFVEGKLFSFLILIQKLKTIFLNTTQHCKFQSAYFA